MLGAGFHDTVRTVIFTGRPMRVIKNPYIMHWEENRQDEIRELCDNGIVPYTADLEDTPGALFRFVSFFQRSIIYFIAGSKSKKLTENDLPKEAATFRPLLMGIAAGLFVKEFHSMKTRHLTFCFALF